MWRIKWDQESTKRGAVKLAFGLAATYFSMFGDIDRAQHLLEFGISMAGFLGLTRDDNK